MRAQGEDGMRVFIVTEDSIVVFVQFVKLHSISRNPDQFPKTLLVSRKSLTFLETYIRHHMSGVLIKK